jgi:IMP cyclohydrolase
VRDALALSHMALDYEKDDYNTPRISAVADTRDGGLWLAVVRDDGLNVRRYALEAGQHAYVTTYEENDLSPSQSGDYDAGTADEACTFVLEKGIFAERTNPVTAVAAVWDGSAFSLAARDAS